MKRQSKYANLEMIMVAKMRLIYPPTITNHVHFIFHEEMGRESQSKKKAEEEKVTNKFKRDESKVRGKQIDNTNRKCIFENDLLQGIQSNVGFAAAAAAAVVVGLFGHN